MKTFNLLTLAGAVLLFSSCIPSVHPFYTAKDVVFEPRLLGEWQEKDKTDDPQIWKFDAGETNAYKLTVTEKEGKRGKFNARLFKLNEEYFLDLIPEECDYGSNQADLVAFAMFPGHLLVRVPQLEPELKLGFLNFDWLQKHLEANPKALAHHVEDKRIVLTADTGALQGFVLGHLGEGELFDKPGEMIRRLPDATGTNQPAR